MAEIPSPITKHLSSTWPKTVATSAGYLIGVVIAIETGIPPEIGGLAGNATTLLIEWLIEMLSQSLGSVMVSPKGASLS
ncbi:MAG: hypothetical protein HKL80_07155 [Acidimicrobiales bacterium]|nr:hypothetical protein [Acidimicrobiales bacterium]